MKWTLRFSVTSEQIMSRKWGLLPPVPSKPLKISLCSVQQTKLIMLCQEAKKSLVQGARCNNVIQITWLSRCLWITRRMERTRLFKPWWPRMPTEKISQLLANIRTWLLPSSSDKVKPHSALSWLMELLVVGLRVKRRMVWLWIIRLA